MSDSKVINDVVEHSLALLLIIWHTEVERATMGDTWDHGDSEDGFEWCASALNALLDVIPKDHPLVEPLRKDLGSWSDILHPDAGEGFAFGVEVAYLSVLMTQEVVHASR